MRRNKTKHLAQVNMVPMIDVMLVLVLILMLCVPLVEQALSIELPKAAQSKAKTHKPAKPWVMSMDRKRRLSVQPPSGKKVLCRLNHLKACWAIWPEKPPVVELRADKRLPYGDVMKLMSALRNQGVASMGLTYELQ